MWQPHSQHGGMAPGAPSSPDSGSCCECLGLLVLVAFYGWGFSEGPCNGRGDLVLFDQPGRSRLDCVVDCGNSGLSGGVIPPWGRARGSCEAKGARRQDGGSSYRRVSASTRAVRRDFATSADRVGVRGRIEPPGRRWVAGEVQRLAPEPRPLAPATDPSVRRN